MLTSLAQQIDYLLAESEVDYINLNLIMAAADKAADLDRSRPLRERTLQILGMLLDRGFEAVDLLPDGKCRAWPDQGKTSILRRIEQDWRSSPDEGALALKYWFDLPDSLRDANGKPL